jgi:hypothetical protein
MRILLGVAEFFNNAIWLERCRSGGMVLAIPLTQAAVGPFRSV